MEEINSSSLPLETLSALELSLLSDELKSMILSEQDHVFIISVVNCSSSFLSIDANLIKVQNSQYYYEMTTAKKYNMAEVGPSKFINFVFKAQNEGISPQVDFNFQHSMRTDLNISFNVLPREIQSFNMGQDWVLYNDPFTSCFYCEDFPNLTMTVLRIGMIYVTQQPQAKQELIQVNFDEKFKPFPPYYSQIQSNQDHIYFFIKLLNSDTSFLKVSNINIATPAFFYFNKNQPQVQFIDTSKNLFLVIESPNTYFSAYITIYLQLSINNLDNLGLEIHYDFMLKCAHLFGSDLNNLLPQQVELLKGFSSTINIKNEIKSDIYYKMVQDQARKFIVLKIVNSDTSPLNITNAQPFSGTSFFSSDYALSQTGTTTVATSATKVAILQSVENSEAPVIKLQAAISNNNLSNLRLDSSYDTFNSIQGAFYGDDTDKLNQKNNINASNEDQDGQNIFFTKLYLMRKD